MTWSAEFEYRWQLFLTGLENSGRGLFVLEYDQPAVRDMILERFRADFITRGWAILPGQFFVSPRSLSQEIERALEGQSAKVVIVHLTPDTLESRGVRMLNMERENLYTLPVNIVFLAHSAAYKRLLVEARDLVTWMRPPYRFTTAQVDATPKPTSSAYRGLPPELLRTLADTLLRCGPFYSARELNAVFTDVRLSPWRYGVPDADNPKSRVQALIAYLHARANVDGDNALALFVRVLRDQADVNDACYGKLDRLAIVLSGGSAAAERGTSAPAELAQGRVAEARSTVSADPYAHYEAAMQTLLARLGKDHPRYSEALVYQQRLSENLTNSRLFGDTETRRAERAEILARLNALTMATFNTVFSELGGGATVPPTTIDTGGGAYVGGNVTTGRDFVGRDHVTIIGDGNVIGSNNQVSVNKPGTASSSGTPTPGADLPDRTYVMRLFSLLTQHFSLDELNTLCFAVGVNYDELPGAGLSGKARDLLSYCERHTCLPALVEAGKTLRPELDWS